MRQTFAGSSAAGGATGSYASAYAFGTAVASPCSARSTHSAASGASSEDDSAARIQAVLRGANTRRELVEMRELIEGWADPAENSGFLPDLPEEAGLEDQLRRQTLRDEV